MIREKRREDHEFTRRLMEHRRLLNRRKAQGGGGKKVILPSFPDATNTGVPAGTVLTNTSGRTISTPGVTIQNENVNGSLIVSANNVTIKNCRIVANDFFGVHGEGFSGLTVQDCEISACLNSGVLTGVSNTILRCNIHDCENGITVGNNCVVRDNYIHNLSRVGGTPHFDCVVVNGGCSHVQVLHNSLYGRDTSCVFIANDGGAENDILVDGNLMIADEIPADPATGIYVIEKVGNPAQITNVTISNNFMTQGKDYFSIESTTPTLINNRDYRTGALILVPGGAFPGQPGNPVGFAAAPGFPGSLTLWPGGALTNGQTYSFFDFVNNFPVANGVSNITFIGCRFQSNSASFNVRLTNTTNIHFSYCSIVPLVSQHPSPTHPGVWPSAGTGQPVDGINAAQFPPYMIPGEDSYTYGLRMDGATGCAGTVIDHCDFWGGAIGPDFEGALDCVVTDCWIHDQANPIPRDYHTNGASYVGSLGGRSNIRIEHCTIASLGNTNGIGFQAATSPYSNIVVKNNYLSGFGYCVDMCHLVAGNNNMEFSGNTLATDVRWAFGPLYADFTSQFNLANPTNKWSGNVLRVMAGTSAGASSTFPFTSADNGKFILPSSALSVTDHVPL
jgi:hypothetical protein